MAMDPVMLTLTVRVPTNAQSFKLATNFFSSEFPEYTCSPFNDFFVVLLDSTYTGSPANPTDKNLAFYAGRTAMKYPVGVNLAHGNTGLFTQCVNGADRVRGDRGQHHRRAPGSTELMGTGLDTPSPGACDANSLQGGGTGWLETSGNVNPGEIMKLRIAIWDTSDHVLDSLAVVDGFRWSVDVAAARHRDLRGSSGKERPVDCACARPRQRRCSAAEGAPMSLRSAHVFVRFAAGCRLPGLVWSFGRTRASAPAVRPTSRSTR